MEKTEMNRRAFLQTAAIAGGAVVAGVAATETASAQMPTFAPLVEKPLRPALLKTEGISQRTHQEHFKLYQGYVKKTNELTAGLARVSRDPKDANATYSQIREMKVELSFALNGVKNHELYFDILGAPGTKPGGALLAEINRSFGSVDAWAADIKATAIAARGWAWTAYDFDLGRLMNYIGDAQNTFPIWNATPIIGLDVYEHAYFIDYGTNRGAYIDAFLRLLDWNAVAARFAHVRQMMGSTR